MRSRCLYLFIVLTLITLCCANEQTTKNVNCENLLVGQYFCDKPVVDNNTQEISGCTKEGTATVPCYPLKGILCNEKLFNGSMVGFHKTIPCRYTNGYSYIIALGLSIFLGWLGIDRFYLGYPAVGLLKFCTFGLCGIGCLVDFLLIALQIILPSDGSNYVINYYGPRLIPLFINNDTFYKETGD
uniref:TM2 domain-containing protein 1-like n=1 Tax=Phallusia mammillata TaxID=59560 RepID=A0A6F9DU88_9ASCI|nr:TM2 domain-containing protein 1-like [Phallusia mammillata]